MRAWLFVPALLVTALPATVRSADFRVIAHDEARVRVEFVLGSHALGEVEIDGERFHDVTGRAIATTTETGAPMLPVFATTIAVPPGRGVSVRIVSRDTRFVPGIRPLPFPEQEILPGGEEGIATPTARHVVRREAYESTDRARPIVALGDPATIRDHEVVPVRVVPLAYRPGDGIEITDRIVFDVIFEEARAPRPGVRYVPSRESEAAEAIYRLGILNAEEAVAWRARRAVPIPAALRRPRAGAQAAEVKLRIAANENGFVRVRRQDLVSIGWNETPLLADLELTTRDFDPESLAVGGDPFRRNPIALLVEDADANGRFDGSDALVFYAEDARTDRGWTPPEDRYSWENVYWLTWRDAAGPEHRGLLMQTRDAAVTAEAAAEPNRFDHWERFERNLKYFPASLPGDDPTGRRQGTDHLFMTDWVLNPEEKLPFDVHDPAPGSRFGFAVEWRGVSSRSKIFTPTIFIGEAASGSALPGSPYSVTAYNSRLFATGSITLDASMIGSGRHYFANIIQSAEPFLATNWFRVGYERLYRAHEGALRFTNGGESGRVRYTIDRFADADLLVFDITDTHRVVRLLADPPGGSGSDRTLVFEDDVSAAREYLAIQRARVRLLPKSALELDQASNLRDLSPSNPAIDADYLIVAYDEFAPGLTALIEHRRGQGHVVELARASDVYDEFGGGLWGPEAIREYVRYAYRMRPGAGGRRPVYLMIVGDASEDYWGIETGIFGARHSAPNYVPSYMVVGDVGLPGSNDPFIATDHWFIANPDGDEDGDPFFSSMMVGRLPTGSLGETERVVAKILKFENDFLADPESQRWRRRALAIADDCYSGGSNVTGGEYRGRGSEGVFETNSNTAFDIIRDAGWSDFEVERFFLADVLDSLPALGRAGNCAGEPACNWTCTRQYCRNVFDLDSRFIERASRGHLIVTYQGHGNRNLISHEYVLMGNGAVGDNIHGPADGNVADVPRLNNAGRPGIWLFFACHVAEFARRDEARSGVGDCLAERLLFHPTGGSVASIASTGFEWITSIRPAHLATFAAWFEDMHLADAFTGEPRLLLGEIMLGAKNVLAASGVPSAEGMIESYITLGDPALRIDIAPPRFQVWQDQGPAPWKLDAPPAPLGPGASLRAAGPDDPTARFAARIFDEVPIDGADVRVGLRPDGSGPVIWMDPSAYEINPEGADPRGVVRGHTLRLTTAIEARDYDLVFEAKDYNGRVMTFPLPARVTARFEAAPAGTGQFLPVRPGAFVDPQSAIRITLTSPAGLDGDGIELVVNGEAITEGVVVTPLGAREPAATEWAAKAGANGAGGGLRSFEWQVETGTLSGHLGEGSNAIGVRWPGGGQTQTREIEVSTMRAFQLDRHFAFPNPFETGVDVFYRVSRSVRSARLDVYTLSGRKIRSIEQPVPIPDLNRIHWDGRDHDGDRVASGVYFYRLSLEAPDGTTRIEQGKLARVVGHRPEPAPSGTP